MSRGKRPGSAGLNYTPLIDSGTLNLSLSPTPGPLMCTMEDFVDEITPIAAYISSEINTNTKSSVVKKMRELNSYSIEECISDIQELPWLARLLRDPGDCVDMKMSTKIAALLIWAEKVRQNGDWDHKPHISKSFVNPQRNPGQEQHWHLYGKTLYYYDVWSNVHYGYVGNAAGFSESALLDGAGLEQIGSTLARFSWPGKDPDVSGLRAFDDTQDRVGVEIGIKLHRLHPKRLCTDVLLNEILFSSGIRTKPYNG